MSRVQMERFKADKFQDFRSILLDFVNLQIAYNERVRVCDKPCVRVQAQVCACVSEC